MKVPRYSKKKNLTIRKVVNHDRSPIVLQTVVVLRLQEGRHTNTWSVHATADSLQLVLVWLLECHCCLTDIYCFKELAFRQPVVH